MKIFFILMFGYSVANAASYTFVEKDLSQKDKLEANVKYPVISQDAGVLAFNEINKSIEEQVMGNVCDTSDVPQGMSYFYSAEASVSALNEHYVSIAIAADDYCGGAHPNYGIYYLNYNSQTGTPIDMSVEFPDQSFDAAPEKTEQYSKDLIAILRAEIKKNPKLDENECLSDTVSDEDASFLYPAVAGLDDNKNVIIKTFPPHVAGVCEMQVPVPISVVEKYLRVDSPLREWLR